MMVLAGPGSGKTTVITERTRRLIEDGVSPSHILVITFTRAAAREMKERFLKLTDGRHAAVTFGTFHAVFFTVLKYAYGYKASDIIREDAKYAFMRDCIYRLQIDFEDENELIQNIYSEISMVKNAGIDIDHYYSTHCPAETFRELFRMYQKFLLSSHSLDFDDMLVYCLDLFQKRKDILSAWQKKFTYILIDEFQDINPLQYKVIRMMAEPKNNLFIVGDDDQSIYHFRGARPELMLHFTDDYPNAKTVVLRRNYRSARSIVKASSQLISWNEHRFSKKFESWNTDEGSLVIRNFENQRAQNLYLIGELRRLKDQGINLKETAVLSRTNRQLLFLMEQMSSYGIPFHSRERIPNLYDHWIARDILTYIHIALGDRSRGSFLRIMNRPNRYLSRDGLPNGPIEFDAWERYYSEQNWMVQRLEKLRQDLDIIAEMRPYAAVTYIRKGMAYEDYLKDYAEARDIDREELLDVLEEITERAREYTSFENWFERIQTIREESKKQNRFIDREQEGTEICTYHSAKGLEYRAVFLPDLNERIVPYRKAVLDEDIEEERRMFYVAMTRAKERLYLLHSAQIRNKDMEPSRFLTEIRQSRSRGREKR